MSHAGFRFASRWGQRLGPTFCAASRCGLQFLHAASRQSEAGAVFAQCVGNSFADSARSAGDDDGFSGDVIGHDAASSVPAVGPGGTAAPISTCLSRSERLQRIPGLGFASQPARLDGVFRIVIKPVADLGKRISRDGHQPHVGALCLGQGGLQFRRAA